MAKPHRGKGIRELFAHGRGECPVCKRNNVKVLYEMDAGEQKFKICKTAGLQLNTERKASLLLPLKLLLRRRLTQTLRRRQNKLFFPFCKGIVHNHFCS